MSGGILSINIFFTFYWCYLQEVLSVSGRLLQTQQKLQTIILIPQALLSLLLALEITQLTSALWITISQSFKRHLEWSSSMLKEEVDFEVLNFFFNIYYVHWVILLYRELVFRSDVFPTLLDGMVVYHSSRSPPPLSPKFYYKQVSTLKSNVNPWIEDKKFSTNIMLEEYVWSLISPLKMAMHA